jgi:flavin-dependent dehydrogenase
MGRAMRAIVVGAGPAGAAAAIWLAYAGHATTMLDRGMRQNINAGETLPPAGVEALRALGVSDRFLCGPHRPSRCTRVAWGDGDLAVHHHLFHPYGSGWQIERSVFDATLIEAAEAAGAHRIQDARVTTIDRVGEKWDVRFVVRGCEFSATCDWLVDATGRGAAVARLLGAHWIETDRLAVQIGRLAPRVAHLATDEGLLVESAEQGWWYSAVLPNGTLIVAHVTDRDGVARGRWSAALASTRHTADRARAFELLQLGGPPCSIGHLARAAGAGWVAIGDAALAHDPLSGQGLAHALLTGLRGGEALRRNETEAYADARSRDCTAYLQTRRDIYRRETRWPASSFWRRRHEASIVPTELGSQRYS